MVARPIDLIPDLTTPGHGIMAGAGMIHSGVGTILFGAGITPGHGIPDLAGTLAGAGTEASMWPLAGAIAGTGGVEVFMILSSVLPGLDMDLRLEEMLIWRDIIMDIILEPITVW